jgi:hypothetical protein
VRIHGRSRCPADRRAVSRWKAALIIAALFAVVFALLLWGRFG